MEVEGDASNPVTSNLLVAGSAGGSDDVVGDSGSQEDLQSQLAAMDVRRAHYQSEADKAVAKLTKIEGERALELTELAGKMAALETLVAGIKPASVDDFASVLEQHQKVGEYRAALAAQYPGVDVKGLKGSFEEMEAVAKAQSESRKAAEDSIRADVEAKVRADYAAKFGVLDPNGDALDQGDGGSAGAGTLTVDGFAKADFTAVGALDDAEFTRYITELEAQEALRR